MINPFTALAVAASTLVLGGCDPLEPRSFADIDAAATALRSKYVDLDGNPLVPGNVAQESDFPPSGAASYQGFISADDMAGNRLVGELTLDVSFLTDNVDGTAYNFQHETDGTYTGTLTGSADLARDQDPMGTGVHLDLLLLGILTNNGTGYATSAALNGNFQETFTDPIGAIAGAADIDTGINGTTYDGTFAAER